MHKHAQNSLEFQAIKRICTSQVNEINFILDNFTLHNVTEQSSCINLKANITYGRFGNHYLTIRKIIAFADYFSIKCSFIKHRNRMLQVRGKRIIESDTVTPGEAWMEPVNETVFFFLDPDSFLQEHNLPEIMQRIRSCATLDISATPLPLSVLAIHIRSGDLFGNYPNQLYVQPPLAWYQACILAHKAHHEDISVLLISEDTINPCINGVIDFCKNHDIPLNVQSDTLRRDLGCLMGAQAIVDSMGSFTLPIKDLSPHLKMVYDFSFDYCKPGKYINQGEWANTPEQRSKMLQLTTADLQLPSNLYEFSQITDYWWENSSKDFWGFWF